jgi:hypothetical protein
MRAKATAATVRLPSCPFHTSSLTILTRAIGSEPAHGEGHHQSGAAANFQNTHSTSSNYGPYSTNAGNKLNPRFDSDMDHRCTTTGSTNVGPHSSNVANKLDPRIDSDADHRANPSSGMGTSGPVTGSSNVGHHTSNFANKLDPRIDSGQDHRANPTSSFGMQGAGAGGFGGVGSTNEPAGHPNVGRTVRAHSMNAPRFRSRPATHNL